VAAVVLVDASGEERRKEIVGFDPALKALIILSNATCPPAHSYSVGSSTATGTR